MAVAKNTQYGKEPKFKSPEQIKELADAYFKKCEGTLVTDHNGDPMLTKWGDPVYVDRVPPTVAGLALALGFKSRMGLMRYQNKKMFMDVIIEAKSKVEKYNEEQLVTRDGSNGAMFSLRNNFKGWNEDVNTDSKEKGPLVSIINDIPKGTVTMNTETAVFNPLKDPADKKTEDASGK